MLSRRWGVWERERGGRIDDRMEEWNGGGMSRDGCVLDPCMQDFNDDYWSFVYNSFTSVSSRLDS